MHAQLQTSNFCSGFITPASRLFLQVVYQSSSGILTVFSQVKRHHFNDNKGLEQVMVLDDVFTAALKADRLTC